MQIELQRQTPFRIPRSFGSKHPARDLLHPKKRGEAAHMLSIVGAQAKDLARVEEPRSHQVRRRGYKDVHFQVAYCRCRLARL